MSRSGGRLRWRRTARSRHRGPVEWVLDSDTPIYHATSSSSDVPRRFLGDPPPPAPVAGGLESVRLRNHQLELLPPVVVPLMPPWFQLIYSKVKSQLLGQLELGRVITGRPTRPFQHAELAAATGNFSPENVLGRGGSGIVYRGRLSNPDRDVAVKVLSSSAQSLPGRQRRQKDEFDSEMEAMAQLRHRNIVELVGWCSSDKGLMLVYELMAKGSLYHNLYRSEGILLSWELRYKIILQVGSALHYLHLHRNKCIVHGDIKPENIMLDDSYNAKLGDFGTTRLFEHGAEPQSTEHPPGTLGYMDPAFLIDGVRRPESDIYSFGVVLLEIACGRRPASGLLSDVRDLYNQSMILDAADAKLEGKFDAQQMERVLVMGLRCAHQDQSQRPSIKQVMDVLDPPADANLPLPPAVRRAPQHIEPMEQLDDPAGESPASLDDAVSNATTYDTACSDSDSADLLAGGI